MDLDPAQPVIVQVAFSVDSLALEGSETAALVLRLPEGGPENLFVGEPLRLVIEDGDGVCVCVCVCVCVRVCVCVCVCVCV